MASLEQVELAQDKRGGADGGDVLGRGELADHVADALIGAQVGSTGGRPPGSTTQSYSSKSISSKSASQVTGICSELTTSRVGMIEDTAWRARRRDA